MDKEQLKQKFRNRDRVISIITEDGKFRIAAIKNTNTARTAQEKHNLPRLPAFFLARQLAAASMMSIFLKGEERIILEADGNGFLRKVFAEAIQVGEVRGFVDYDNTMLKEKYNSLKELFNDGTYKVTKILYSESEPITGIVPIQQGDTASDLSYYFFKSEQIPSIVILDTYFDDDDKIKMSSGIIIQSMPGVTHDDLVKVDKWVNKIKSLNRILEKDPNLENLVKQIVPVEFDVLKNNATDFFCRCSKDSFIDKLVTFDIAEIEQMRQNQQDELVCQYCNAHYYLTDKDFDKIITTIKARNN